MEQNIDRIDPNDLLIFGHISELGSFSKAASKMGLPKSTVSRRLAALEEQLGERLLLRTTRRQTLTEFGNLLLDHARQVMAEVDAVADLRDLRQAAPSGRLRVSMPSDIGTLLLADALADFSTRFPAITLQIDLSARRVDLLSEGFDVAVRMGELASDSLLAARRLSTLSAGLYASPDYLARHGEPRSPDDLEHHQAITLLRPNGDSLTWQLSRGARHWEGLPPGRAGANSPEMLIQFARAGAGLTCVPDVIAAPEVGRGKLRRVLSDWTLPAQVASAVFPGRKLMPAKTRVFIDMLHATFDAAVERVVRDSVEPGAAADTISAGTAARGRS